MNCLDAAVNAVSLSKSTRAARSRGQDKHLVISRGRLRMSKQLLILDVDETLVYADETPLARAADFRVGPFHVYGRPFLREFVAAVSEWFDLAVWSSASASYVNGVAEHVFGVSNTL